MGLNNRELATLIWLAVFAAWILSNRGVRSGLGGVVRSVANPVLLVPLVLMLTWIAGEIWIGTKVSLWNVDLASDTVAWTIGSGLVLYFNANKAAEDPGFFRKTMRALLQVGIFAEFFVNLFVLNLGWELLLVPTMTLIALLAAFSELKPELKKGAKFFNAILATAGFGFLGYTLVELRDHWHLLNETALLLQFLLPVWLTLGVLPFVYLLALFIVYDRAFRGVTWATKDRRSRWKTKFRLLWWFGIRRHQLRAFNWLWIERLAKAANRAAAKTIVREFREQQAAATQAKERALVLERQYAGSNEEGADGRRLDRREFLGSMRALRTVALMQANAYRNRGQRYRDDLIGAIGNDFTREGLPKDSGIVMTVAANGKSWYAWRRTITGWCFAIGSSSPPPSEWEFDGPEPPTGFPGKDPAWGRSPDASVNNNWDFDDG